MRPFFATIGGEEVLVVNSFALLYDKDTGKIGKVRFLILNYSVNRRYWQLVLDEGVVFERFASDAKVNEIMVAIRQDERKKAS